jgi:hypothetical protein
MLSIYANMSRTPTGPPLTASGAGSFGNVQSSICRSGINIPADLLTLLTLSVQAPLPSFFLRHLFGSSPFFFGLTTRTVLRSLMPGDFFSLALDLCFTLLGLRLKFLLGFLLFLLLRNACLGSPFYLRLLLFL